MTGDTAGARGDAAGGGRLYQLPWDAVRSTLRHGGTRLAGALTYYATLSLAPAVIVLVALVGLFGDGSSQNVARVLEALGEVAPAAVVEALQGPVTSIVRGDHAGRFIWIGLGVALWAASGYVGAFIWTAGIVCGTQRAEPLWRRIPRQLAIAAVTLLSLALITTVVVLSGPVARWVADVLDLGDVAVTAWSYGRWAVFVLVVTFVFGLLYRLAPTDQTFRLRWASLGGLVAALLALAASFAFSAYVANVGSYDRTYGALTTFVVFLVWLWLVNLMLVFGLELNVALARRRGA